MHPLASTLPRRALHRVPRCAFPSGAGRARRRVLLSHRVRLPLVLEARLINADSRDRPLRLKQLAKVSRAFISGSHLLFSEKTLLKASVLHDLKDPLTLAILFV